MAGATPLSPDEFARRVIEPSDFVADTEAFVDVRIPRSRGKASYSFIGPGVSQNADQTINLVEPHGFNVGAATMPHGQYNNPHLHYTPEVFICTRGQWRLDIGREREQSVELGPGGVFSTPTWVFRGFENLGDDDGFLFVVLGGDETGGIIWEPNVLREAAATGMFLGLDNSLIDTGGAEPTVAVLEPLADDVVAGVDSYTDAELADQLVTPADRCWADRGLLSAVLGAAHSSRVAPVIGYGISQDRRSRPPITTPHGFSLEWLELDAGASTGRHQLAVSQVVMLIDGEWELAVNDVDDEVSQRPQVGSLASIPAAAWRDLRNVGGTSALAAVVTAGDGPCRPVWCREVVDAAAAAGFGLDAAGCVAPLELLASRS